MTFTVTSNELFCVFIIYLFFKLIGKIIINGKINKITSVCLKHNYRFVVLEDSEDYGKIFEVRNKVVDYLLAEKEYSLAFYIHNIDSIKKLKLILCKSD